MSFRLKRDEIHLAPTDRRLFELGPGVGRGLVHQAVQTKKQFFHQKRLAQVIVGPQTKAFHSVRPLVARREEQNRRLDAFQSRRATHREAIHPRHHHIQNGGGKPLGSQRLKGIRAVVDLHHFVPFSPQIQGQHLPQRRRVLGEEQTCGGLVWLYF